jgi:sialate O-acetylesterase
MPKGLNNRSPSVLFNGMIRPLIPFSIRGVIWYQGEANVERPAQYRKLFPALIRDWRSRWGIGDFPFYFVQIAPFSYKDKQPGAAYLREAQLMTLSEPNTGMAVTMDIGDPTNIHPKNKKPVGERLALLALARDYGRPNLVDSGPRYQGFQVDGDKIRLEFNHVGSGLTTKDGRPLTHFTIAGADQKFVPAEAVIDGGTIVVSSAKVSQPVAVRYGWGNADMPNLANKEGLPSSSFRTDEWPIPE